MRFLPVDRAGAVRARGAEADPVACDDASEREGRPRRSVTKERRPTERSRHGLVDGSTGSRPSAAPMRQTEARWRRSRAPWPKMRIPRRAAPSTAPNALREAPGRHLSRSASRPGRVGLLGRVLELPVSHHLRHRERENAARHPTSCRTKALAGLAALAGGARAGGRGLSDPRQRQAHTQRERQAPAQRSDRKDEAARAGHGGAKHGSRTLRTQPARQLVRRNDG
jgi:hypothetical protein